MEIFLANLQIKLEQRGLIVLPAKPASQPYKHSNKIQCRYELQISAKQKSNRTKIYCHLSLVVSQPVTSIVGYIMDRLECHCVPQCHWYAMQLQPLSVHHPSFETWAYGLTTAWPCPRTSPRSWPAASLRYDNCAAYDGLCRTSLLHDSWSPSC